MHNPCWIELDRNALRHNCEVVRQLAPRSHILAMVKANGYGHGAQWVAEQLRDLVQGYGVARYDEAASLREACPHRRILLLGNLADPALLVDCARLQLDVLIHTLETASLLSQTPLPTRPNCWLKLNVGMNRLGMSSDEFQQAHTLLAQTPQCGELLHMSHFSEAEDVDQDETRRQCSQLQELSDRLGRYPCSLANSAAIIAHPDSHRDWVRPGIMLYGDDPTGTLRGELALQPVMQFRSRIIALRELQAGDGVGYNRRWRSPAPRQLATVAAGYADGYPRSAPDGTPVLVNGQRAHLAGRVSMDLLTIDVSELELVKVGDEVTLWGDGLPAAEIGRHCNTISYELFTRIAARVERRYR